MMVRRAGYAVEHAETVDDIAAVDSGRVRGFSEPRMVRARRAAFA